MRSLAFRAENQLPCLWLLLVQPIHMPRALNANVINADSTESQPCLPKWGSDSLHCAAVSSKRIRRASFCKHLSHRGNDWNELCDAIGRYWWMNELTTSLLSVLRADFTLFHCNLRWHNAMRQPRLRCRLLIKCHTVACDGVIPSISASGNTPITILRPSPVKIPLQYLPSEGMKDDLVTPMIGFYELKHLHST